MFDRTDLIRVLGTVSVTLLVGCGGGGGSGGGATATGAQDGAAVELLPSTLEVVQNDGTGATATVRIVLPAWADRAKVTTFDDSGNLVDKDATWFHATEAGKQPAAHYLSFVFPAQTVSGTRTGTLTLKFACRADTTQCPTTADGRTVKLPYVLRTGPHATTQTPLKVLAGAAPWQGFQGSARRTGYVPAAVDASRFSRRFELLWPASAPVSDFTTTYDSVVATTGGRALLRASSRHAASLWQVSALQLDESTGRTDWVGVNPPSTTGSTTEVATTLKLTGPGTSLVAGLFVANGGGTSCRWAEEGASLFASCRTSTNPLFRITPALDSIDWKAAGPPLASNDADSWPALSADTLWLKGTESIEARTSSDGTLKYAVASPAGRGFTRGVSPVVGDDGSVFVLVGQLPGSPVSVARIDAVTRTVAWTAGTQVSTQPVLAKGVLYVMDGSRLLALDPRSGAELWSWEGPWPFHTGLTAGADARGALVPLLVVGDYAFLSTLDGVRAIDLRTRTIAWGHPSRGRLAVSDAGLLYIVASDRVSAVNLQ